MRRTVQALRKTVMTNTRSKLFSVIAAAIAVASMVGTPAEARRGGSFGSRGSKTFSAPSQTSMMPRYVAPVQRSMTQPSANGAYSPFRNQGQTAQGYQQSAPARRFGGFGGGLVGGLLAGGIIGSMMGHGGGWGAGSGGMGGGFLISLIQIAVLGGIVWFVIGFFRRKPKLTPDSTYRQNASPVNYAPVSPAVLDGGSGAQSQSMADITLIDNDKADFERLLTEVQDAFGREDYGRLRAITTPEIMSYLSEELSQNATSGRRNDVSATRLIDAEVSEAWREDDSDYATIAMRYSSIDVMRDRATNAVVEGNPNTPTETSEVWTFVRPISGAWKLSAIQE